MRSQYRENSLKTGKNHGSSRVNEKGGRNMSKKERQAVWLYPETKELMMNHLQAADAKSQSEYIEKAVKFYTGYLDSNSALAAEYMSRVLVSIIDSELKGSEQRICRLLFKLAVEVGALTHLHAAESDVDEEVLDRLRAMCIDEVRSINGIISFERAIRYQRSDD